MYVLVYHGPTPKITTKLGSGYLVAIYFHYGVSRSHLPGPQLWWFCGVQPLGFSVEYLSFEWFECGFTKRGPYIHLCRDVCYLYLHIIKHIGKLRSQTPNRNIFVVGHIKKINPQLNISGRTLGIWCAKFRYAKIVVVPFSKGFF